MRIYLGRAIFFGFNMERSAEVPSASPYSISLACSGLRYWASVLYLKLKNTGASGF